MSSFAVGTRVREGSRVGVVEYHRPQGMVDVCFDDKGIIERRPEGNLVRLNPAKAATSARSGVRGKPAPVLSADTDLYDPTNEQFRAVVQGIYESLITKELGAKAFRDAKGKRVDVKALAAGDVSQTMLREVLSRAYAIATRRGQKYGYLEPGSQRPTKKGAALSAARYGADPAFVRGLIGDDPKALKLAAAKDASKRAENRQDYEITLQLVRKGGAPRVVEELVAGKVVSLVQPGAKRLRKNAGAWELRGAPRGMFDLPSALRPLVPTAQELGKVKGQLLRALSQVRRPAAKADVLAGLADNSKAFRKLLNDAAEALGMDAVDERGITTPAARQALMHLTRVYEDIATDVQSGRPVRNPLRRNAGAADFTTTTLAATAPALDPQHVGYFVILFDGRNRGVDFIVRRVGGWSVMPNVTTTKYLTGVVAPGEAGAIHTVVKQQRGPRKKFFFAVVGPRAGEEDVFERKEDAEKQAQYLDARAASFLVEETHTVSSTRDWDGRALYEVHGPRAEDEVAVRMRRLDDKETRGEDVSEDEAMRAHLRFYDEGDARRTAKALDFKEAKRDLPPIKGYRTAVPSEATLATPDGRKRAGQKAVENYNKLRAALDTAKVYYTVDASVATTSTQDMVRKYARGASGALVLTKPSTVTAAQKRFARRELPVLRSIAFARGEDAKKLKAIAVEAEDRGRKAIANAIVKVAEAEATQAVADYAFRKLGAVKYARLVNEPREEVGMRGKMPGGFNVPARAFEGKRRVAFKREETLWEHIVAAVWPDGKVPEKFLPRFSRDMLLELPTPELVTIAREVGIPDAVIAKKLTSAETSALSKVLGEREGMSGVEMIGRGGFTAPMTEATRQRLEAQRTSYPPRPRFPKEAAPKPESTPAPKGATVATPTEQQMREMLARLLAERAALEASVGGTRRKNGLWSAGAEVAVRGGRLAAEYGTKAYGVARTWASSPGGRKMIAEVASIGAAMFGARAVRSGKLSPDQAALIQSELERRTGQKADPAKVALALHLAGE